MAVGGGHEMTVEQETAQYRCYIGTRPGVIHGFELDTQSGSLTPTGPPVEKDGAGSFLAPTADGSFLYAVAKPGAAAFRIDRLSGALEHINTVACQASSNAHVAIVGVRAGSTGPDGETPRALVLAAYGGSGVNVVKIHKDGSLLDGHDKSTVFHTGGSNVFQEKGAQDTAHPHSAFPDRSGQRVLVSDLGQDKIYVYKVHVEAGTLEAQGAIDTAPGAGPRHVCFHPKGCWVYSINELDCTISTYAYDGDSGAIGPLLQTLSTLPEGYNNRDPANALAADGSPASGPNREGQTNACAEVQIAPDGRFLYGSNRGHDSLVRFSVDSDGMLTLQGFTPTGGAHPRAFGLHPSGAWLVVANQDSDNVVVFKVDRKTGSLERTGQISDIKQPRCVQWALKSEGDSVTVSGAAKRLHIESTA